MSILALVSLTINLEAELQKHMIVIIPSYNNARWYKQNLDSVFSQEYDNFHVIYVDDCSRDTTGNLVRQYVQERGLQDRITLILNPERHGAMYNLYYAIHACADDAVIVTLDGDDWFAHPGVLQKLNEVYADPNIWLTYGQYVEYPSGQIGFSADFPPQVIQNNSFRTYGCPVSHLRTFYAGLFKKIKKEDLYYKGEFFPMTWDKAIMLPMLEMCGGKFKFIPDILYVYNFANPINDCRVNGQLQANLVGVINKMPRYQPLDTQG